MLKKMLLILFVVGGFCLNAESLHHTASYFSEDVWQCEARYQKVEEFDTLIDMIKTCPDAGRKVILQTILLEKLKCEERTMSDELKRYEKDVLAREKEGPPHGGDPIRWSRAIESAKRELAKMKKSLHELQQAECFTR